MKQMTRVRVVHSFDFLNFFYRLKCDFCCVKIRRCPTLSWSIHSSNNHSTVAFLVTWPVSGSEAGGRLEVIVFFKIQTLVIFI